MVPIEEIHVPVHLPKLQHFCNSFSFRNRIKSSKSTQCLFSLKMHAEIQLVFQPCPICACTPSPTTTKNYTARAGYYTVLHLPCNLLLHCSFAGKMLFRMFVISFHPLISYVLTTQDLQRGFKYQMKSVWCQEP